MSNTDRVVNEVLTFTTDRLNTLSLSERLVTLEELIQSLDDMNDDLLEEELLEID